MSDEKVIRLIEERPGFKAESRKALVDWLRAWADHIEKDNDAKTLLLIVETDAGAIYKVVQTTGYTDKARVLGLLAAASHRVWDDGAPPPVLEKP